MWTARPLGDVEVFGRPALDAPASGVGHRNTSDVTRHPTAILVARQRSPDTRDVDLRVRRVTETHDGQQHQQRHAVLSQETDTPSMHAFAPLLLSLLERLVWKETPAPPVLRTAERKQP